MKLTVKGQEYPVASVGDWTFDEADTVLRQTSLTAGGVLAAVLRGDQRADKAFATVAYIRAGKDPDELGRMRLDDVVFDPSEASEETKPDSPPAVAPAGEGSDASG